MKLIAFDLDGTLLTDDKRLTERTEKALKRAAESGIRLAVATGRPLTALPERIKELPFIHYAITTDGARIEKFQTGEIIYHKVIAPEKVRPIFEIFKEYDTIREIYIDGVGYIARHQLAYLADFVPKKAVLDYLLKTRRVVDDLDSLMDLEVEKAHALFKTVEDRSDVIRRLSQDDDLTLCDAFMINLEISAGGVDKGEGLKILGGHLGIDTTEMAAFGDSNNDAAMLKAAGLSICMANGDDRTKRLADLIAPSNDEDGVAQIIEALIAREPAV